MRPKNKFIHFWKSSFLDEAAGGAGGSGAGGGAASGEKGGEEKAGGEKGGEKKEEAPQIDAAEFKRLQDFESKAKDHVEVDESGNYRPKAAAPAPEPLPKQDEPFTPQQIAGHTVQLIEANNAAKAAVIEKFKASDPLFAKNMIKAEEKISKFVPIEQRNATVWERAYNQAMGETAASGEYEKHYVAIGRQQATEEFEKAGGMSLPAGSGATGAGSKEKPDLSKVTLSREQRDAAQKLINGGFLKSMDEYKENLLMLEGAEA